ETVGAPIKAGDVIGTVDYYLAGQKVGTSQLVSHTDVERSSLLYLTGKLTEAFTSLYFRVVVAVTLTLFIIYLVFTYRRFRQHEKMQKVHRRR
ncbi:MAG: D-alanyl-D-alanine carboxypeptidase, partial [Oscillospiraceae bacterium]|nr:D-alanyl-D-alanine carboxypeptidase [Oscillospiraceae bacterium]